MKRLLSFLSLTTLTVSSQGQLADMFELPEEMAEPKPQFSSEEILQTWGWLLADRFTLKDLELSPVELDWIVAGMRGQVEGEEIPTDFEKSQIAIQEYFAKREEEVQDRKREENRQLEEAFFDSLFGVPGMQSLATGLHYQIIRPGNEVRPEATDTVVVRYEGRLLDNTVFDSTEGQGAVAIELNQVIAAWTQGIPLIGEGGKIKLYVPSKLGYGDNPYNALPPAATLVFEVELLKVGLPEGVSSAEELPEDLFPEGGSEEVSPMTIEPLKQ